MADSAHERITIAGTPERCWATVLDYERYPDWAKDVKKVEILDRDAQGRGSRVEFRAAAMGRSIRYVLVYDYTAAPQALSWKLEEGDMLRRLDGTYAFESEGDGTLVTYDLEVDISMPLPGLIKRRAAGLIMGNALKELKKAVEREA